LQSLDSFDIKIWFILENEGHCKS